MTTLRSIPIGGSLQFPDTMVVRITKTQFRKLSDDYIPPGWLPFEDPINMELYLLKADQDLFSVELKDTLGPEWN